MTGDQIACVFVAGVAVGTLVGSWMRGRRDDRDQAVLLDRRRRYALAVRGVPPLGDPDGGRRAD